MTHLDRFYYMRQVPSRDETGPKYRRLMDAHAAVTGEGIWEPVHIDLSAWERTFLESLFELARVHGPDVRLSPKQEATFERIEQRIATARGIMDSTRK